MRNHLHCPSRRHSVDFEKGSCPPRFYLCCLFNFVISFHSSLPLFLYVRRVAPLTVRNFSVERQAYNIQRKATSARRIRLKRLRISPRSQKRKYQPHSRRETKKFFISLKEPGKKRKRSPTFTHYTLTDLISVKGSKKKRM